MTQSIQSVWARAFAMSVLFPAAAWAQSTTPPTAQSTQTPPIDRYVVGQAKPPDVPGTTQQELTLEQAIVMSLEKNLALQVAKLAPQLADYSLQSARAAFLPRYTSSYSTSNSTSPSNDTSQGVLNVTNNNQGFNGNFAQLLPWHGGNLSANFTNSPRRLGGRP